MELVKQIVKVGNSAGIILPREWLNGTARVELINKPLNIKKEIIDILDDYMENIQGIYLVGSYARNEQTERSDIDFLIITNNQTKKIQSGKYNILMISEEFLIKTLENDAIPILPMIKEAKVILNKDLIEKYKSYVIKSKNVRYNLELIQSALNINDEFIKLNKETEKKCGDAVAYSLVLNLRTVYLINCLIKGKKWSNKEFLNLIKKISGSDNAYSGYLRVKDNKRLLENLPIEEAEKLYIYVKSKLEEIKEWVRKKE